MLGFLSEKKFNAAVAQLNQLLEAGLAALDERLQKGERQERRRQAALENMLVDHSDMLEYLRLLYRATPPVEKLMAFAEAFALWRLATPDSQELKMLSNRLDALLTECGLEIIADRGAPFNPERHEACHARFEAEEPVNSVLEIIRPGFLSQGHVLRYASVVVNRPEPSTSSADDV